MRPILPLAVAFAFAFGSAAFAACPDKSQTSGISKDGTQAPLQDPQSAEQPATKDGNTMPLASQEGGGNKDLATSQQDVEAQQQGEKTAAAQAEEEACKD